MDAPSIVINVSLGAGGAVAMQLLFKLIERRRAKGLSDEELFPNGERDDILKQVNYLRLQNLARTKEHAGMKAELAEIKGTLNEISERLAQSGI